MESDVRKFDFPLSSWNVHGVRQRGQSVLLNEAFTEGRSGGLRLIKENIKIYNVVV